MKKYSNITGQTGQVAQTLAYLPYGEDWVDVIVFLLPKILENYK